MIDIGWGGGVGTQLGHAARIQAGQYLNNNTETCPCVRVSVCPCVGTLVSYWLQEVQQAQAQAGQWAPAGAE